MKWFLILMSAIINIGSGNGNSAQAQQFFDRLLTPPNGSKEAYYAQLIDGLYTDGTWQKLDGLYVFGYVATDEAIAKTNLIQDAHRVTEASHRPTITGGYISPQGSDSTESFNFNPSTANGNYALNSACMFAWNLNTVNTGPVICTINTGSAQNSAIWQKWTDTHTKYGLNGASIFDAGNILADGSGFFLVNRTSSNAIALYRNGASISADTTPSTALENFDTQLAGANTRVLCAGFGASLTATQINLLYTRLRNFALQAGISVP